MTILGWDMSHYDSTSIGNALSQGIRFITHKAGGDANDAELASWWSGVKNIGQEECLLGAYWVLRSTDGAAAADAFVARLDSQCSGWRNRPFILQLDCESWNGGATPAPTKAQIKACADRLRVRMPKLVPIVYAPEWVYGASLAGLGYPLWASKYVSGVGTAAALYPGDNSYRWDSYSGQIPAVLQFTSSAMIGGQTTCDANAFRGTLAQMTALLAPGWIEEDMALNADDAAVILNTDGIIGSPAGSVNSDGTPNAYWSLNTYIKDTNSKARQALAAVQALASPAAIAAAVIAALPAGSAGELTEEELQATAEAAVRAVLGSLDNA